MIHIYAPTGEPPPPKYDSLVEKWSRESEETKRALQMLRTCLTDAQWYAFDRHGGFITENGEWMIVAFDRTYQLRHTHSFNTYDLVHQRAFCVHVSGGGLSYPRDVTFPGWPDHLIAQKLAVESDPERFRSTWPHATFHTPEFAETIRKAQGLRNSKVFDLGRIVEAKKKEIRRHVVAGDVPLAEEQLHHLVEYLNRNIVQVVDPAPLNVDGTRYLGNHLPEGDRIMRVEYDEANRVKLTRTYDHRGVLIEQLREPY